MQPLVRGGASLLLFGDVFVLYIALFGTLYLRYGEVSKDVFILHATPFTVLFVIWIIVFFIAGLYDRHVSLVRKSIPSRVFKTQAANILIAALFFFTFDVGIEPKTNLVIYLVLSSLCMLGWRLFVYPRIVIANTTRVLVIGDSDEALGIAKVFANNPYFKGMKPFMLSKRDIPNYDEFRNALVNFVKDDSVDMVIADMRDEYASRMVNDLYTFAFEHKNIRFYNLPVMYEALHHRVPPSLIEEMWFLENITTNAPHYAYDIVKRAFDMATALILLIPSLVLFPLVMLAIYLEDRGKFLYKAERVGKYNKPIYIYKFRTMSGTDNPNDALKSTLHVTRVGAFLRKTRIDELPQLFNVLRGDISFIGPRPEIPTLAKVYAENIPYYNMRHLVTPGLSGWAQIHNFDVPRGGVDIPRTIDKLSFDLYYLKHRSLLLDIEIALKTIHTLLMRSGT